MIYSDPVGTATAAAADLSLCVCHVGRAGSGGGGSCLSPRSGLSHLLLLLGLERDVRRVLEGQGVVLLLLSEHPALLVVRGYLDVIRALGAAARAALPEEDKHAVPCLGAEGEVEHRVEEGGCVHGPLHNGPVALAVETGDECLEWSEDAPGGEHVVDVEELVGRTRGLEEEDEEEGDDGEPELGRAELPRAASADLDEEGTPRDEEKDDGQREGAHR
jgi:hypothetical protein